MYIPKIGDRVALSSRDKEKLFGNGSTATIIYFGMKIIGVEFDGGGSCEYFENELYFPNHPLAYNQKCFQ